MADSDRKPPLFIDLNEAPSPPSPPPQLSPTATTTAAAEDALALVLKFHGKIVPAGSEGAASFPGEAGGVRRNCGICGKWEVMGGTVVCDGCEAGFHVACLRPRQRSRAVSGDWECGECELSGPTQKRWALGDPRGLLDINAKPPEVVECGSSSRMNNHKKISSNCGIEGQDPQLIGVQVENVFALGNHTGTVTDTLQTSSEAVLRYEQNKSRGSEDLSFVSSARGRPALSKATRLAQSTAELFLSTLRNFILERGGVLGEGWQVEFIRNPYGSGPNPFARYCAPDGKKFESMFDVACHLGLLFTPLELDAGSVGSGPVQRPLPSRRRKNDVTRKMSARKLIESHNVRFNSWEGPYSDKEVISQCYNFKNASEGTKSYMKEIGVDESPISSVELPIRWEDFFVLCLGKIDARASYHDCHQIWPIGYRSIWHDKFTGSLFQCEVSDGGDPGPIFSVRRFPCSSFPMPKGATILLLNKDKKLDTVERIESNDMTVDASTNEEDDVLMLLSDPDPLDRDFSSCFDHIIYGNPCWPSVQTDKRNPDSLTTHLPERKMDPSDKNSTLKDEIGEFYVQGSSSAAVWKMVSRTFIDTCLEVYRQSGCLQFYCRHEDSSTNSVSEASKEEKHIGLARFSYSSWVINTPRLIQNDSELEDSFRSITKWLEQDRFGLDMGFVQEIIETLPASHACTQYHFLNNRSDFPLSCTVGSGSFLAIKNEESGSEEVSYGLYSGKNRPALQNLPQDPQRADQPPPGRSLSSKIPSELVGDVFQIWEFLWRFCQVLGLNEILSFEELEEELIDPWPSDLNQLRKFEKENQDLQDMPLGTGSADCPVLLPSGVSDPLSDGHYQFKLIPVEMAAERDATQDKVASHTYGRCCGVALTKVHISLLKVLVGELLSKVAVFLDPNIDARESKSRRGRKKVTDNASSLKETKNDLPSINELTWPEIARRYILAVLLMNGRMDSQDVCGRESLKVFRCLEGDGGVICGSLSGIAGMEADALILAEAERQLSYSTKQENDVFTVEYEDSDAGSVSEPEVIASNGLPEWAKPLEPVRKLPTNVGTRIRKCVYESLEKNPPEWAKEALERSISKEVYKGNASGPTKKAVLSVLAKLTSAPQPHKTQKPDQLQKGKRSISVSEFIMKKCRFVLRSAVSADEDKIFCNLLGTTLLNSIDNNENGILGSPAMVSRPLDFRTIDSRLAAGAYGGSHDSFLEDVREVWHNLRTAYADQPDLILELEKLSDNFESLYEMEVLHLVNKFDHRSEQLDVEIYKGLKDILFGGSVLPKAPWEDGVCKVCGLDKDDDSVLLCDKCDSEYHRYCLNPPLARIPEGNWFCPSCAVGQHKVQDGSNCTEDVASHSRRQLVDETYAFHDTLRQLATTMEVKEYWEFNMEERISLLKFLCDEVLNSALLREHLEQCVDKANAAQQKLYALTIDLRNLKCKEDLLAMRTGKEHASRSAGTGVFFREETTTIHANQGRSIEQHQHFSNKVIYSTKFSGSPLKRATVPLQACHEGNGQIDVNKDIGLPLRNMIEDQVNSNKPHTLSDSMAVNDEPPIVNGHVLNKTTRQGNPLPMIHVSNSGELNIQEHAVVSSQQANEELSHGADSSNMQRKLLAAQNSRGESMDMQEGVISYENGIGELPPSHQNTVSLQNQSDGPSILAEPESSYLELDSLRNEISQLQDSIGSLESQVMLTSSRRDLLGIDSVGRLYWVVGRPGKRPWLVVGGSWNMQWERSKTGKIGISNSSRSRCNLSFGLINSSPMVFYESETEIQQLVNWFSDNDPRERELKENILHWQRLASYEDNYTRIDPKASVGGRLAAPHCLTKAATVLENKYGPWLETEEACEIPKQHKRRPKLSNEERMYRCECLESVWPSRYHCLSCHQTFCLVEVFEAHKNGRCALIVPVSDESKESEDQIKGKTKFDDIDTVEISKKGKFDVRSKLLTFPKKACPYDLEEICKKFISNDSNKEVVNQIGLIGSCGIPSLISSSPMFCDPPLILHHGMDSDRNLSKGLTSLDCDTKISECYLVDVKGDELHKISSAVKGFNVIQSCRIPDLSMRPLAGKVSHIFKRLKMNLLDIEAALPEEALRPSSSHIMKRCAWRAFVKSAGSIFEMVQATILLEGMIKAENLRNGRWYWSSLTAAAKTSTVLSLALRIYTLDDSILYIKESDPEMPTTLEALAESSQVLNKTAGKKRKVD